MENSQETSIAKYSDVQKDVKKNPGRTEFSFGSSRDIFGTSFDAVL